MEQATVTPAAFRQWLKQQAAVVGYTHDRYARPLAVWLAEVSGSPCTVWDEQFCVGSEPWKRLPEWAVVFTKQVNALTSQPYPVTVTGEEALAVLDVLAEGYPACAEEEECLMLRQALQLASGAVTRDGKSHVRYHEDYHIELNAPWVYYPNLAQRELWILRDDELEDQVAQSQECCWLTAEHFIW